MLLFTTSDDDDSSSCSNTNDFFYYYYKQIPGRNEEDNKSKFSDIKDTVNSAAASAYQKITGNEYGKTLTEKELAIQNAKKMQEHHRPPALDWNATKKDGSNTHQTTMDKDGKFFTAIGAMKSGGGYDVDPVQGDASLETKMKGLGVENPGEKKSFAWNDPPPPKKKEMKKKKKKKNNNKISIERERRRQRRRRGILRRRKGEGTGGGLWDGLRTKG